MRDEELTAAERAADLFNHAQDVIYSHDMTRFTAVNQAVEAITGYPPDVLVGMRLDELLTPESLTHSRQMLGRKVDGEASVTTYQVEIIRRDGRRVPLEVNSWIVYRDGRPVGVQGIARDITARLETERALQESEARFRRLAENAPDYIYRFEYLPTPRFTFCSPAVTSMFGYTPEEFYADPDLPLKILVAEDRAQSEQVLHGRHVAGQATLRVRHKEGRIVWAEFRRVPVYDDGGAVVAVEAIVRDVTERKRAEDRQRFLAQAGELLAGILDEEAALQALARLAVPALADWCTVDLLQQDGVPVALAGSHRDPARARLIRELQRQYPADPAGKQPISTVLRTGRSLLLPSMSDDDLRATSRDEAHYRLRRDLGYVSAMFVPLRAREGMVGIIGLVSADPERRYDPMDLAMAEELARQAALTVENARMYRAAQEAIRSRDAFLSVAAHELRTPITSLRGYAQLLMRQTDRGRAIGPEQLREAVATIGEQALKLTTLIGQLLDVTRLDAGKLTLRCTPTDVAALLQRLIADLRITAQGRRLTLAGPTTAVANVDALRLEQVMVNLVANAFKFSPEGEPVEVTLTAERAGVTIDVADRGPGVAPEQRERIFDRYAQAQDVHAGGMGLGLWISRQIVELHGGRLTVEPRQGGGSRFIAWLPR